jgi:isochorismate synthase
MPATSTTSRVTQAPRTLPGDGPISVTPLAAGTLDWYRSRGEQWLREHATVTWERPSSELQVFGLGTAIRLAGPRGEGIASARASLEQLLATLADSAALLPFAPMVFAGACFDPANPARDPAWDAFGGWQVVVPAITILRRGNDWSGIACAGDFPGDLPGSPGDLGGEGPAGLAAALETAVREIRGGRYQKVVLAASRSFPAAHASPADIVGRLATNFPTCCIFSIRAGRLTWLGASPEPLAVAEDGALELVSLAGSRRRGGTPAEDAALEADLLANDKERWEHQLVVDAIQSDVEGLVEGLHVQGGLRVMKLANIQHLCTPLVARLAPGASLLDLVERLHPTPAVGGWPRPEALEAIRRLEDMDRGWYAGPVGWIDSTGNGEFVVGLRTALVGDGIARLYAGAGIVCDSLPAAELEEIETKLDALRGVIVR